MSKASRQGRGELTVTATGWRDTAFICRKCSKRQGGGFGEDGKQSLRGLLRDALRRRGWRGQIGLIDIGCLGICPKNAVVAGLASTPGALLVVPRGAKAGAVLDRSACSGPEQDGPR